MEASPALSESCVEDRQRIVLAFLRRAGTFAPGETAREIDTHAASVFLVGDRACKLKRAVRFGYLDFSTIGKRHDALCAELELNRRTAPDLYLDVVPISRDSARHLVIGGTGEPVDWLLRMRRFPDEALLVRLAEQSVLGFDILTRLADRIVDFHARAEVAHCDNAATRFASVIDGNAASLASYPEVLAPKVTTSLCARHRSAVGSLSTLLDDRGRAGRVRHAHGDLHLANIAMIDGAPTMFDCLEFSTELATIDVLYDIAFLIMDLWQRGMRTEANILFNRYLDLSPADEGGVALMPLFVSVRATVRAHVMAAQSVRADNEPGLVAQAQAYLDVAMTAMDDVPARLVAIGGLSGTGKSSLARSIGGDIGRVPGARILRNDVLRKRLAGVAPETRLEPASYTAAAADRVYEALDAAASTILASGQAVVADAVFAPPAEREAIECVAKAASCRFDGVWLTASDRTRQARVTQRQAEASDAGAEVALAQSRLVIGDLGIWKTLSADGALSAGTEDLRALLAADSP